MGSRAYVRPRSPSVEPRVHDLVDALKAAHVACASARAAVGPVPSCARRAVGATERVDLESALGCIRFGSPTTGPVPGALAAGRCTAGPIDTAGERRNHRTMTRR